MKIFISGSTGFIGKEVVNTLAKENHELFLLIRKKSLEKAKKIFTQDNIKFVQGDLVNPQILDKIEELSELQGVECILHIAALYDLQALSKDVDNINTLGTKHLLTLSSKLSSLKSFHHISSYVVSKGSSNLISPYDFTDMKNADPYSRSKIKSEKEVIGFFKNKDTKLRIYRPGIVIAKYTQPKEFKLDGPYLFQEILSNFKLILNVTGKIFKIPLPFSESAIVPIVSLDFVSQIIKKSIESKNESKTRSYHLVSKDHIPVREVIETLFDNLEMPVEFIGLKADFIFKLIFKLIKAPSNLIQFMYDESIYCTKTLDEDFNDLEYCSEERLLEIISLNT